MKRELYVYYRVEQQHASLLLEKAGAMHRWLSREYGIVTGLKRRPQSKDCQDTWMEVYLAISEDLAEDFEAMLERAVGQFGLLELTVGQRHSEHFWDYSACA